MSEKDNNSLFQNSDGTPSTLDNSSFGGDLWNKEPEWLVSSDDLKNINPDLGWDSTLDVLQDYAGAEDTLGPVQTPQVKNGKTPPAYVPQKAVPPAAAPWMYSAQYGTPQVTNQNFQGMRSEGYPEQSRPLETGYSGMNRDSAHLAEGNGYMPQQNVDNKRAFDSNYMPQQNVDARKAFGSNNRPQQNVDARRESGSKYRPQQNLDDGRASGSGYMPERNVSEEPSVQENAKRRVNNLRSLMLSVIALITMVRYFDVMRIGQFGYIYQIGVFGLALGGLGLAIRQIKLTGKITSFGALVISMATVIMLIVAVIFFGNFIT